MDSLAHERLEEIEGFPDHREPLLSTLPEEIDASNGCPPIGLAFRSSKIFITIVVCIAVFTDTFLYTLIIPILPNILTIQAGVPNIEVQKWISTLLGTYGAANLLMSPTAGYVADLSSSRRTPLLFGLCTLTAATTMFSFGRTPMILVLARALQGASAAIVRVVGLALISDTMGATSAGEAMGWQSMGMFAGSVLGPSLGGVVYDSAGHYAVFGMAYVVLGIDIVLRTMMIERKIANKWTRIEGHADYGTMPVENMDIDKLAVEEGAKGTSPAPSTTTRLVDADESCIPSTFHLFSNPRFLMALWATFVCSVLMTALESVLPLYVMNLFVWTPTESGFLFILLAFSVVIDPYIGHMTDVRGPKAMVVFGLSVGAVIWSGFCIICHNTLVDKVLISSLLFLLGFSIGLIQTPNMVEVSLTIAEMNQMSEQKFHVAQLMGRAYSFLNMGYGIGSVTGPIWGGDLKESVGWKGLCGSFVALNAGSACLAYTFSGGPADLKEVAQTDGAVAAENLS